ncbi:hypothetical protein GCM10007879_09940 [Maritalea porphyrae]|uniref:Uncharacterized protein n=2 Tax=Maritalea porphyrae TaxID=880732 RepID=A0ABQ5UQY3_9HYPH|nr:hypothetical protein GCM10007879_09940 [Maritalea porphyrae]
MILKFSRRMAFAILSSVLLSTAILADDESCFEQFKSSICSLNENGEKLCGEQHAQNQPYIEKLGTVFELMPPISQKLMCSLSGIEIVDDMGNADGRYFDETRSVRVIKDVFEPNKGIYQTLLIYEESTIEIHSESEVLISAEQLKDRKLLTIPEGRLYWVLTHEIGHHLDEIATFDTSFSCLNNDSGGNRFGAPYFYDVLENFDGSGALIPAKAMPELYEWLNQNAFVSMYALTGDYEDFAETFAYYILFHKTSAFLQFKVDGKEVYSTRSSAFTESKAKKFATLEYLIDAYMADDDTVGLKMLTCDYLDELDIN